MFSQIGIVSAGNNNIIDNTVQEVIKSVNENAGQAILDDRRSTVTSEWDDHPRSPGGQPERVVLP